MKSDRCLLMLTCTSHCRKMQLQSWSATMKRLGIRNLMCTHARCIATQSCRWRTSNSQCIKRIESERSLHMATCTHARCARESYRWRPCTSVCINKTDSKYSLQMSTCTHARCARQSYRWRPCTSVCINKTESERFFPHFDTHTHARVIGTQSCRGILTIGIVKSPSEASDLHKDWWLLIKCWSWTSSNEISTNKTLQDSYGFIRSHLHHGLRLYLCSASSPLSRSRFSLPPSISLYLCHRLSLSLWFTQTNTRCPSPGCAHARMEYASIFNGEGGCILRQNNDVLLQ